jgi:hypothetical protein
VDPAGAVTGGESVSIASTTIDNTKPIGYAATGPRDPATAGNTAALFCNTSQLFGLGRDNAGGGAADWAGMKAINFATTVSTVSAQGDVEAQGTQGPVFLRVVQTLAVPGNATDIAVTGQALDFAGNAGSAGTVSLVQRTGLTSTSKDVQPCKSFTDVSGTDWFAVYVRYLGSAGLIAGFPDGSYRPNDPVTRAQLATLLVKALGYVTADLPTSAPSGCAFTDVGPTDWFAGWVWQACQLGIMVGVGGGKFAPNDPVTRGQAATAVWKLSGLDDKSATTGFVSESVIRKEHVAPQSDRTLRGDPTFLDVPIGAFYTDPVKRLYNIGVIDGTSATTFSPNDPVTRAQIAVILYRALGRWFNLGS